MSVDETSRDVLQDKKATLQARLADFKKERRAVWQQMQAAAKELQEEEEGGGEGETH
jgi:hypothetical protein